MLRCAVAILGLALACGCNKDAAGPTVSPAVTDTVEDQGATFQVDVGWRAVTATEVELVVKMTATGIEQTDKLVVDVKTNGFVVTQGVPDWSGFIQPREKYTHRVSYQLLDDEDSGRATVTISRSMDGTLLWDTELLFAKDGGQIRLAQ
ncbi:MAG: hypothetical protein KDK70_16340 [Myxococcales bacterium]|nr:hypothetical protein [Myxococcales bacterium]